MTQLPSGSVPPPPPIGGAKVVIAALCLGVVAVVILSVYIQGVKDQVAANQFTVFILQNPVKPGQRITSRDWKKVNVPDREVFRQGLVDGLKAYTDEDALLAMIREGRQWERHADKNVLITPVLFSKLNELADPGVTPGKVRKALPVKSSLIPTGLNPGVYVDIAAPMMTGGTIPAMMIVMQHVEIKTVGTYTITESQAGEGPNKPVKNFNSISFDVDQKVALELSTLERMVAPFGQFEVLLVPTGEDRLPKNLQWRAGEINPDVLKLIEKNLPAAPK